MSIYKDIKTRTSHISLNVFNKTLTHDSPWSSEIKLSLHFFLKTSQEWRLTYTHTPPTYTQMHTKKINKLKNKTTTSH